MSRLHRALRARLTYANAMSTLAVFLVLGGGAYAATTLPADSVGTVQLRREAVTRAKIADESVGTAQIAKGSVMLNRLSDGVRGLLAQPGPAGAVGAAGPVGPPGPPGPKGKAAGAHRITFDAAAEADPSLTTVLDMPGFKMQVACVLNGNDVGLRLRMTPPEDTTLQETISIDAGSDPQSPGGAQNANLQIVLPAGFDDVIDGPMTQSGSGYFRVIASALLVSASHTISLHAYQIVNADTGRCQFGGTAMPAEVTV